MISQGDFALNPRFDGNLPFFLLNRLNRITNKVQKYLHQPIKIDGKLGNTGIIVFNQLNMGRQLPTNDIRHLFQYRVNVMRDPMGRLIPSEHTI